jgi:hypothetical protein
MEQTKQIDGPKPAEATRAVLPAVISDTFVPRNLAELKELATFMALSDLIPKSLMGKKENVAIVLMLGHEIGVPGVAALSNIYVVNGRPSIWGDLATALVRRSGLCESLSYEVKKKDGVLTAIATGHRKGDKGDHTVEYSWDDAKLAGLVEKDTWRKSPKDMLMWKALHRLFKFLWPDVLKGLIIKEIAEDFIEVEAEQIVQVEKPIQGPAPIGPKAAETKPPEPTTEELEELRKKKAVEYTKLAAKVESKAPVTKKEEPSPDGLFEGQIEKIPEEPASVEIGTVTGTVEAVVQKRVDGIVAYYSARIKSASGENVYLLDGYEMAVDIKNNWKGKVVKAVTAPVDGPAIEGVVAKIVSYGAK